MIRLSEQLLSLARIEVWDEGVGLPPPELERVFERFYRAPGGSSGLIAIVTLPVV